MLYTLCPSQLQDYPQLPRIQQQLSNAINIAQQIQGEVPFTSDATILWDNEYPTLTHEHPGQLGVVVNRAEAHVIRLALHYALIDSCDKIGTEHLTAALAAWDYCFQSAEWIFGRMQTDPDEERIITALTKKQEMSLTDISNQVFSRNMEKTKLHSLLTNLIERRLVTQTSVSRENSKKPVTIFSLKSNEFDEFDPP